MKPMATSESGDSMISDGSNPAAGGRLPLAWRLGHDDILRQRDMVLAADGVRTVLDRVPQPVVLLNRYRQIVYANAAMAPLLPLNPGETALGRRPGEAMHCLHSDETPEGCGTTPFCKTCGAAKAMRAGQRGDEAMEECRIISRSLGHDFDLRIWASPITVAGEQFTMLTLLDITAEKRRETLERVFFHDILNTAGGIQAIAALCSQVTPEEREGMSEIVARLSETLVEELRVQQSFSAMERGDLPVSAEPLSPRLLLESVAESYRTHSVTGDRHIVVSPATSEVPMVSDAVLLRRVIGNMTKNALEACPAAGTVTLTCTSDEGHVTFRVHNPTPMPASVQLQLFQRSFSTKGPGRGLGTYSMKLLSERYLGGHISFASSDALGTVFIARYPLCLPSGEPGV